MPEVPDHASAGGGVDGGSPGNPNPAGIEKRMREATGVYDYDNTMRPLSAAQRRTSEGTTFKAPSMKPITPPGGRTFI